MNKRNKLNRSMYALRKLKMYYLNMLTDIGNVYKCIMNYIKNCSCQCHCILLYTPIYGILLCASTHSCNANELL